MSTSVFINGKITSTVFPKCICSKKESKTIMSSCAERDRVDCIDRSRKGKCRMKLGQSLVYCIEAKDSGKEGERYSFSFFLLEVGLVGRVWGPGT